MHSSINADQLLRGLALSIARNNVGAMRPTHEIAAAEGLTQTEYDAISQNPQFKRYVDQYETELKDSGFSFAAKSRILAEDLLPTAYHMARDPDTPAAVRRQIIADMVEWGELKPKNNAQVASGPGFSITFNIPSIGQTPAQTVVLEAQNSPNLIENDEKTVEDAVLVPDLTPLALPRAKIELTEPDDYEYGGDDIL
jgi:hypothetical protein